MVSVKDNSILKKTVAVILMITALVFFTFNVFADTPVQPLQVVSYSDTSTNVRIVGTAERLHYNIDSFQVVFMNPPNNYGTSCTPVLVTLRFFNASDTPAYVGQPEFELTASSSTGNVNTIIYGYDQISTDLFVAESTYSTSEVGRIGIGASNDFAYYTGFVIPPRTALYFSCIVYVNASAYAQNNTGAQEDVNQVTLSALNFYNNQISFSADYPYHNQPIDFSDIINAISDLSDTVSTSSEMSQLINAVTYNGTYYSSDFGNGEYLNIDTTKNNVRLIARIYRGRITYSTADTYYNAGDDTSHITGTVRVPYNIYIQIRNTEPFEAYYIQYINHFLPYDNSSFYIDTFVSDIYEGVMKYPTHALIFQVKNSYLTDNNRVIIPAGNHILTLTGYVEIPAGANISLPNMTANTFDTYWNNSTFTPKTGYYPSDSYVILKDLYTAYSQVNGLDNSSDISNDVADVSDSNHIIEESYYSANASAIEATGLSNYRFSNEQNNGIGTVADDFMLLWNALGSWNGVYIFSLTMALATFIMRHGGLFTIKREVSDKGGDSQ